MQFKTDPRERHGVGRAQTRKAGPLCLARLAAATHGSAHGRTTDGEVLGSLRWHWPPFLWSRVIWACGHVHVFVPCHGCRLAPPLGRKHPSLEEPPTHLLTSPGSAGGWPPTSVRQWECGAA